MNSTAKLIQALLFYKGEPQSKSALMKSLAKSDAEIEQAIGELRTALDGQGIVLLETGDTYTLATSTEASELLETMRKEELSKELSKASVETLAIIAYTGATTRHEIDYIRGVNSSFILRALLIRGLVEKFPNPKDSRTFIYKPSMDLLAFIGSINERDFPEYERFHKEIVALLRNQITADGTEATPTPTADTPDATEVTITTETVTIETTPDTDESVAVDPVAEAMDEALSDAIEDELVAEMEQQPTYDTTTDENQNQS